MPGSKFGVFIINSNQIWDILFGRLPFSEEEEVEEEEEEEEEEERGRKTKREEDRGKRKER